MQIIKVFREYKISRKMKNLFYRICTKLSIERSKLAVKPMRSAWALQDGEDDEFKLVLELGLFHNHAEQGSNR